MIKLYEVALSGNSHKARMLLSMLGLPYESVSVNLADGEQRTPGYLALNPFGQVPTLVDDDVVVRDSQAILVYLASRYGGERWWPREPSRQAGIVAWLSTAANEIAAGPGRLRLHYKWGRPIDLPQAEEITCKTLSIIEATLKAALDWRHRSGDRRPGTVSLPRPVTGGGCRPGPVSQHPALAQRHPRPQWLCWHARDG